MKLIPGSIPRGIIYHSVMQELAWLIKASYTRLDDTAKITRFEDEFAQHLDSKYCTAFPFARTAIYSTLKALDLPAGAEVLMPPITIKSILDVVIELELKPVFVDIDPTTFCFDESALSSAVTDRTAATIITYLFGIVPDIASMVTMLKQHDVFVIEDFSQCLFGSCNGKYTGTFGDVGIYSASSIKTLDTFGGGFAVCDDDRLDEKLKAAQKSLAPPARIHLLKKIITNLVRNIATSRWPFHLVVFPLLKLIKRISPQSTVKHMGDRDKTMIKSLPASWFCAFTSLQADIGMQLISKVEIENQQRIDNVRAVSARVPGLSYPSEIDGCRNVYWQFVVYFPDANITQQEFQHHGVDTSTTSLVLISSLSGYPYQSDTPYARRLYNNGMFIPAYPGLQDSDIDRICSAMRAAISH